MIYCVSLEVLRLQTKLFTTTKIVLYSTFLYETHISLLLSDTLSLGYPFSLCYGSSPSMFLLRSRALKTKLITKDCDPLWKQIPVNLLTTADAQSVAKILSPSAISVLIWRVLHLNNKHINAFLCLLPHINTWVTIAEYPRVWP